MRAIHRFGIGLAAAMALGAGVAVDSSADTAADKAGRGLAGMTTGFLELPGHMVVETREHGPA